jgi:hypothetical protein
MPPKKKAAETPVDEQPAAPVVETAVPEDNSEEVLESRHGFTFFRKGKEYSVKNPLGVVITPFDEDKGKVENLFRGMSRKF